jgi:hypothetical protein
VPVGSGQFRANGGIVANSETKKRPAGIFLRAVC